MPRGTRERDITAAAAASTLWKTSPETAPRSFFGAEHANVQPHSGANANLAVFFALLNPGDTVMGMNLSQGGHLSHGSPLTFRANISMLCPYGVDPVTEQIDYDEMEKIALECKPKMIVSGASAYSAPLILREFARYATRWEPI